MTNLQKSEAERQKIIDALGKISFKTATILKEIAENKNPVVDTDYLKEKTNLPGKELGASLNALTMIKINDKQLIERLPFKESKGNSKYFWNEEAAYKGQVFLVLKEVLEKYGV